MLGNFPQAYSHVGLINCALNLSRQTGPAEERAESHTPAIAIVPWAASSPVENCNAIYRAHPDVTLVSFPWEATQPQFGAWCQVGSLKKRPVPPVG